MWGFASCALLLASSFMTSCEKDEESTQDPAGTTYTEKVLVSASMFSEWGSWSYNLAYDSKGVMIEKIGQNVVTCYPSMDTLQYTYNGDSFVGRSVTNGQFYSSIGEISGKVNQSGCVTSEKTVRMYNHELLRDSNLVKNSSSTIEYQYNELGRVSNVSIQDDSTSINHTIRWEDGSIVENSTTSSKTEFFYKKEPQYKNLGKLHFFTSYFYFPDAAYGAANEYLPVSITYSFSDGSKESYDIEYTFDEDGYPATVKFDNITRVFTWKKK